MSVKERDPLTGHLTTGHEWNGITELNTRVPRAIWWFIAVTHIYALIAWILLPTWPLVSTYTKGILGTSQESQLAAKIAVGKAERADWGAQIDALPVDEIRADPVLMARVDDTAHQIFGDNCAGCHGTNAAGGPGFPSLVDEAWLWGGDPDTIMETLRVGINAQHEETRIAQMLAFGRDQILSRDEIRQVVTYVQSLSTDDAAQGDLSEGETLFVENCASCHNEDGTGNRDLGAPDLTDDFWIYGGDDKSLFTTIYAGRQGWMPSWEGRLSETDRKLLTVYLTQLGAEAAQ